MSSAIERLKALAAAKKAEAQKDVGSTIQEQEVATGVPKVADGQLHDAEVQTAQVVQVDLAGAGTTTPETERQEETDQVQPEPVVETSLPQKSGVENPLIMELAELEEQLNNNVPDFRISLKNIHQKLRQDPAIVTIMTDEEIGLVLQGLIRHANAEIVAPKAIKAAKKAAKGPVSADDL